MPDIREVLEIPVHVIDLHRCVWPSHDIAQEYFKEPERRRENDNTAIFVELLVTGDYFVHDGRHRAIRALLRGEHQIRARVYTKSLSQEG